MTRKSDQICPTCHERSIVPPLALCQDCFAKEALCLEAYMQIERDHGVAKAVAALPILKKAYDTGWKDEYREEYQQRLQAMEVQA